MLLGLGTRAPSPDRDLDDRESYAPGTTARLVVFGSARGVELRIFHTGPEHTHTVGNDELQGLPVGQPTRLGTVRPGLAVPVTIGDWPSGL
jgi:hypothetical protein